MPFLRRAYMGRADREFADLRVGNLAQRLGLRIVEGDPELNMIQAHTALFLCADPAVGRALAPALAGLRRHNFVHFTCAHGRLSALGTRESLAMVAHQLPERQAVLLDIADVLSGAGRR
ncbi:MAG TPA: hypothetical protein VFY84_19770 [Jiangellales bacterium]|nr:hypothetical protein [Jiangellales bacterium]